MWMLLFLLLPLLALAYIGRFNIIRILPNTITQSFIVTL